MWRPLRSASKGESVIDTAHSPTALQRMSQPVRAPVAAEVLTSHFRSGDALRSRSVSDVVLMGTLDVPAPPARLIADWEREISMQLRLQPGDVEALPLARARARWPDYRHCAEVASDWVGTLGVQDGLADCEVALMACRGARYHHDADQYGGAAFCNLFLSEDKGLDLHFPSVGRRIPLTRGTAVVFDTGQPHAVIDRNADGFEAAHFGPERDCSLMFLTWELPIENADVARALGTAFDVRTSWTPEHEQLRWNGAPAAVCPDSGQWRSADRTPD